MGYKKGYFTSAKRDVINASNNCDVHNTIIIIISLFKIHIDVHNELNKHGNEVTKSEINGAIEKRMLTILFRNYVNSQKQ